MDFKGRIVVYSIVGCPHCMRAKNTLSNHQLPFTDISLDSFPQCRAALRQSTGKNTVPQVFFNSVHVGGNDDLEKLVENESEFRRLVEEVKNNIAPTNALQIPDPSTAVDIVDTMEFVCEPDEYARLVEDFKRSNLIKDNRSGLTVIKNSFTGSQFVKWATNTKRMDHSQAVEMGEMLLSKHFGRGVKEETVTFKDDDTYYRLVEDDESNALNVGDSPTCSPRSVNELGEELRRLILKIYSAYLSSDGKKVNYKGISKSAEFEKYVELTKDLARVKVEDASREEKIAFFINIYNALVIHANITRGPPTNLWQRYKFFSTVYYVIGGLRYNLQDIENGVLRANRKGVGMFFRPFGSSDQRLQVALETPEPLIHFALVCGAKSCPPIRTYSALGINEQLLTAAEAFLEGDDGCKLRPDKNEVCLSMIFKWYRPDFGNTNEEVIRFVYDHMANGEKKTRLAEMMSWAKVKLSYLPYDWGRNSK